MASRMGTPRRPEPNRRVKAALLIGLPILFLGAVLAVKLVVLRHDGGQQAEAHLLDVLRAEASLAHVQGRPGADGRLPRRVEVLDVTPVSWLQFLTSRYQTFPARVTFRTDLDPEPHVRRLRFRATAGTTQLVE